MVLSSNDVVLRDVIIKHTLAAADAFVVCRAVHFSVSIQRIGVNRLPIHFVVMSIAVVMVDYRVCLTLIHVVDEMGLKVQQLSQSRFLGLRDGGCHS